MLRAASNYPMHVPILALAFAIFLIDAFRPFDIAVTELYVIVILFSARVCARKGQLLVVGACMAMTIVACLAFHLGAFPGPAAGRCLVSLGVLGIAGYLVTAERDGYRSPVQSAYASRADIDALTASMAHAVNQPLAAISMNGNACLRWIDRAEPNLPEARAAVARMLEACRHAGEMIGRLRTMAARADQQLLPVDSSHLAGVDERAQHGRQEN